MGCAEGLAPCLIGEFSAIRQYCGSDKFPNKLRYFLRKYPAACRLLARNHTLFFPFRSVVGGGAVVSVFKGFFARGGRMQGLGEEYYPKYEGGDCSPNGVAA